MFQSLSKGNHAPKADLTEEEGYYQRGSIPQ